MRERILKVNRLWYMIYIFRKLIACSLVSFILGGVIFWRTCRETQRINSTAHLACLEHTLMNSKLHLTHKSLIVLIMSGPNNLERRDVIRQTWLHLLDKSDVQHYFVIGTGSLSGVVKETLNHEYDRYGDLLLFSHISDSYKALTEKLAHSLSWIDDHFNVKFVMKVDDDSFVRLDRVYKYLKENHDSDGNLYMGFFDGRARVKRRGQWAEKEWYLCDYYLPYALGGGYIIGSDLVSFVARNKEVLQYYKNEDVSLGTWLAPLKTKRVHDPRFDTEYKSRGCFNTYIVTHKQSVIQMQDKYDELVLNKKLCPREVRTRYSYVYNWNVPPSQCCFRNNTKVP